MRKLRSTAVLLLLLSLADLRASAQVEDASEIAGSSSKSVVLIKGETADGVGLVSVP